MPKRITVFIDYEKTKNAISKTEWSGAAICRMLNKHSRWLSDVKKGKNLPSPEEAAQMCAMLNVQPEEIISDPDDAEKVRSLILSQKPEEPVVDSKVTEMIDGFSKLSDKDKDFILGMLRLYIDKQGNDQ